MTIKVLGKNIDVGENLRGYASDKVEEALDKYSKTFVSGQVSVEKSSAGFTTHCAVHLTSGIDMQSTGDAADAYASVDAAVERLEKRLRRYKRRLKNHHHAAPGTAEIPPAPSDAVDYTIQAEDESVEAGAAAPVIVAEMPLKIRHMSVSDAVMQMDLSERMVFVFRNAGHGGINVVYRRSDGNIGWIDPKGVAPHAG